ncbi:MAG: hypothetical protein FWC69_00420 [Defluviitaleaceae bacterium]|nr:hypothetical protein [Defluviitaleaceae bacterium]
MEKELFDDLMQSLNEGLEYVKGNEAKGRSSVISVSNEEIERSKVFYQKFETLPETSKQKAMEYVDELLQATSG